MRNLLRFTCPYSHLSHQVEYSVKELIAVRLGYTHSNTHFSNKCRCSLFVKAVRESSLHNSDAGMYPYKVNVQHFGIGQQLRRCFFRNTHLRNFSQEYIACVDVDTYIRTLYIVHNSGGNMLSHRTGFRAGKNHIHIKLEYRHLSLYRIHSERIHRRIYINYTAEQMPVFAEFSYQLIANVLPLQLIAVNTCNYTYTLFVACKVVRLKMILFYHHPLIHRE